MNLGVYKLMLLYEKLIVADYLINRIGEDVPFNYYGDEKRIAMHIDNLLISIVI